MGDGPFVGALTLELPTDADQEVLSWIAAGTPPIYFGLGSTLINSPAETSAVISTACAQLGERVLICSGPNDFSHVEHLDHVKVVPAVNHAAVFPACRAVVHHGGAGTTAAGLRAGIPTLILWLWLDPPMWAAGVQRLEAGFGRPFSQTSQESLVADLQLNPEPDALRHPSPRSRHPYDQTRRKPRHGRGSPGAHRPPGTLRLTGFSPRGPVGPHPAHRAGLDGVDRQRAVSDPPSGVGPPVLIVVAQMPDHIGQLIPVSVPVMRHAVPMRPQALSGVCEPMSKTSPTIACSVRMVAATAAIAVRIAA